MMRATSRQEAPELCRKQGGELALQCINMSLLVLIELSFAHHNAFSPLQRPIARSA
jgi:hypothetical protein